jgi:hypothetical protein
MTRPSDPSGSTGSSNDPHDSANSASGSRRLVPSSRRSELREALDAATGSGQDDCGGMSAPDLAADHPDGKPRTMPRSAAFFGGVLSNALGGVLATLIVALAILLWTHFHSSHPPADHLPARPAATATTRR